MSVTAQRPATPVGAPAPPADRALHGVLLGLALCLGTAGVSLGAGALALAAFPLAAVGVAAWSLLRRRWYAYAGFVLVLWLLSGWVRRVVDWQTSYHEFSVIVATPAVVSLLAVPWVVLARRRVHRDAAIVFGVAGVVLTYALLVGAVRNGPMAAAADAPLFVAPYVLGLFLMLVPDDTARLRRLLADFAAWGAVLLGGYAVIQFLVLPTWDQAWMLDSQVGNLGTAEPRQFRTFSTLGTASYLGQVLAAMLLVLVAERRTPLQLLAMATGLAGLGLTQSRQGWLVLIVGIVVLLLLRRLSVWRLAAVGAALFVALSATGSPVLDRVSERIEETLLEGAYDDSLEARTAFQSEVAPSVLADVDGVGLGGTGRAALVGGGSHLTVPRYVSFDSGVLETLVRYGSIGGVVFLGALAFGAGSAVRRSRHGTVFDAAIAAGLVALLVGMLFQDTTRGAFGVMLWTLLAVAARPAAD